MARPPLPVGTWGSIRRTESADGRYVARCRFRDFDGRTRIVEAWGKTGAEAERRLKSALVDRAAPAGDDITANTRLSALALVWLREIDESSRASNTKRRYHEVVDLYVSPGVGGLQVREATVSAMDRFLRTTREQKGAATAKLCKSVLSGMLGLAARNGATASNALRDVVTAPVVHKPVRALTTLEAQSLRSSIRADTKAVHADLPDLVDMLLGTGARIGEVLAVRWPDIDLMAVRPTLTIAGTVIRIKGEGLTIQEHPKSKTSRRRLTLPPWLVTTLLHRQIHASANPWDVVFPSSAGTLRDATNVNDQWRKARGRAGFDWVTPHTFRKSVATLLAATDLRGASSQLGHSGTEVTNRHYVVKTGEGPDVRLQLTAFDTPPSSEV